MDETNNLNPDLNDISEFENVQGQIEEVKGCLYLDEKKLSDMLEDALKIPDLDQYSLNNQIELLQEYVYDELRYLRSKLGETEHDTLKKEVSNRLEQVYKLIREKKLELISPRVKEAWDKLEDEYDFMELISIKHNVDQAHTDESNLGTADRSIEVSVPAEGGNYAEEYLVFGEELIREKTGKQKVSEDDKKLFMFLHEIGHVVDFVQNILDEEEKIELITARKNSIRGVEEDDDAGLLVEKIKEKAHEEAKKYIEEAEAIRDNNWAKIEEKTSGEIKRGDFEEYEEPERTKSIKEEFKKRGYKDLYKKLAEGGLKSYTEIEAEEFANNFAAEFIASHFQNNEE